MNLYLNDQAVTSRIAPQIAPKAKTRTWIVIPIVLGNVFALGVLFLQDSFMFNNSDTSNPQKNIITKQENTLSFTDWMALGIRRASHKDNEGARQAFEEALKIKPKNPEALSRRGWLELNDETLETSTEAQLSAAESYQFEALKELHDPPLDDHEAIILGKVYDKLGLIASTRMDQSPKDSEQFSNSMLEAIDYYKNSIKANNKNSVCQKLLALSPSSSPECITLFTTPKLAVPINENVAEPTPTITVVNIPFVNKIDSTLPIIEPIKLQEPENNKTVQPLPENPIEETKPALQNKESIVTDNEIGWVWAQADNGSDITWSDANEFCERKGIGWSLPTIEQLNELYSTATTSHAPKCDPGATNIKHPKEIDISCSWLWSSQARSFDAEHFNLAGLRGGRNSRDDSKMHRALCIRKSSDAQ